MKRTLQTIFLSLFVLLQLLLPLVQAEVFQLTTESETIALELTGQIGEVTVSVAATPATSRQSFYSRLSLSLVEVFSLASAVQAVPHTHITRLPINDGLVWPQAPPYPS